MRFWLPLKDRVQSELLKRGHCVACAMSLADAERTSCKDKETWDLITCKCRRIYIYDKQINSYRRAKLDEVE